MEEVLTRRHRSPGARRASLAFYLALLTAVAAIGSLAPWMFHSSAVGIDSPDDLAPASVVPQSYRQGDGGPYSETDDTYISSGSPNLNFGTSPKLFVDGSGCKTSSTTVCKTLINFPAFIGPHSGQVPLGSAIASAHLDLLITNKGVTQDVFQVTQSWSEATATWSGFSPAGTPGTRPRESVIAPSSLGLFSIDLTSIVQRWANGEPNEGILLASDHPDGVDYESSESTNPPTLTVQFSAPPASTSPAIRDLGTLPGDYHAGGRAINEAGDAVGSSYGSADDYIHGILWKDGTIAYLGDLGGGQSYATAINDAGWVVGSSCIGPPACNNLYDAFVWENGTMSSLPKLYEGGTAGATGINDAGQAVGSATTLPSGYGHAALWEAGNATDLGTLGGYYSGATAINDAGQVAGWSEESGDRLRHPFLWDGSMTDLGTLSGDSEAGANAMNDIGQVVGWSATMNAGSIHAFLWEGGSMVDLGGFGGTSTIAYGINDAGQVVGQGSDASGHVHAFLWEDGTMTDLGTLGGGYGSAFGINDAGQVVGESTASDESVHAVIWTLSSTASGPTTLTFQRGDGGTYSETDDAYISSGAPNANFGTGVALFVDGSGCKTSASTVCKALIQFPNFMGPNTGQVAPGSVIVSAILQFEITNPGGTQFLYQITEGWTESGVTWNAFATPGSPTTKGIGILFNAPLGVITVNITSIVQNWVNGDANYGLLIRSTSTDGVDYRSSESASPPKLIVTFRLP